MIEEYRQAIRSYEVSNLGNVRRKLKNGNYKNVSGFIKDNGYRYLQITINRIRTNIYFHHLVAKAFIGERPLNYMIDHIDRNKLNNKSDNLRYATSTENNRNTERYRADIQTNDPKERNRIMSRESYYRRKALNNIQ